MVYPFLWLIAFLPIVVWAYIFSNVDSSPMNRARFFAWIFAWAISVLPVLYLEDILTYFNFSSLNLFDKIYSLSSFFSAIEFWFSVFLFTLFLFFSSFVFLIFLFFKNISNIISLSIKNLSFLFLFWFIVSFIAYFLWLFFSFFPSLDFNTSSSPNFFWNSFSSLKLVIFYYIIVWLIEELSKHFTHIKSSFLYINNEKKGVLYAIFIALWFTFIENILYINTSYQNFWLSSEVFSTLFFRSIFSAMVHIFSSVIVWYYFSKAILEFRKNPDYKAYFSTLLTWFTFWVFMHTWYDTLLTLNFPLVLFIYFAWGYFYTTGIFYKN